MAAVGALGRKAQTAGDRSAQGRRGGGADGGGPRALRPLDILVNNAGTTKRGDFLELTDADWAEGYALKFFAHVRLSRAAWPLLRETQGSLITIGGTSGRVPTAGFTIGSSVNAACAAFSKALADLGKTDGVQVNSIHPSYVETERFWRRIKADMERTGQDEAAVREWHRKDIGVTRFGTPADIAGLVAFIVSPRGRWLHGATIDMDGGEVARFSAQIPVRCEVCHRSEFIAGYGPEAPAWGLPTPGLAHARPLFVEFRQGSSYTLSAILFVPDRTGQWRRAGLHLARKYNL